ncbi:hypothetical protein ACLB2K_017385 [Fragaria x ananassa]
MGQTSVWAASSPPGLKSHLRSSIAKPVALPLMLGHHSTVVVRSWMTDLYHLGQPFTHMQNGSMHKYSKTINHSFKPLIQPTGLRFPLTSHQIRLANLSPSTAHAASSTQRSNRASALTRHRATETPTSRERRKHPPIEPSHRT